MVSTITQPLRPPIEQTRQDWDIKTVCIVRNQISHARQVRERFTYLAGPILVSPIGIEVANSHNVKFGRVVQESVCFDVKCGARAGTLGGAGHDKARG
jgi:hypothetical protein